MIRHKRSLTGRVLAAALALVFGAASASGYTIVMRDGRRVEIPDKFTVTNSTVTYEVGNGFQVTMQLNTVDIPATEKANNEAKGAFLLRANAPATDVEPAPQTNARRSITNADLEEYRRARVESDKAYERLRRELGLPSLEERRREAAAIQDRTLEQARNMRKQQEMEEEAYWRRRAELFRANMDAINGQTVYGRSTFGDFPWAFATGADFFPVDGVGFGTGFGRFRRFGRFPISQFPGFLSTPITPFPTIPAFRRPVFVSPRLRGTVRPAHPRPIRHGFHR